MSRILVTGASGNVGREVVRSLIRPNAPQATFPVPGGTEVKGTNSCMVKRLSSEPEGSGTMLDNTLVLWADTLSAGGGHSVFRMPWFLAGNVNNYFRSGRHVITAKDTPTNPLLVSIASALGVAPPEGVFGNPKFGKGELPGLR